MLISRRLRRHAPSHVTSGDGITSPSAPAKTIVAWRGHSRRTSAAGALSMRGACTPAGGVSCTYRGRAHAGRAAQLEARHQRLRGCAIAKYCYTVRKWTVGAGHTCHTYKTRQRTSQALKPYLKGTLRTEGSHDWAACRFGRHPPPHAGSGDAGQSPPGASCCTEPREALDADMARRALTSLTSLTTRLLDSSRAT